ncbi:MAG: DUF2244 domain-containing protein [Pseudomonadota bacterium]
MPYRWSHPAPDTEELELWPHRSLTKRGFVWFMAATMVLWSVPLLSVLGTAALWWMLPFILLTIGALWFLVKRNYSDGETTERLSITHDDCHLHRDNPRGPAQDWHCNTHWVSVQMHETNPRVPHYVTLRGAGREVEIGAFLSEDERLTLFDDLKLRLAAAKTLAP